MQCESCGEEIPSDSLFCPECGSRVNASGGGMSPAPSPVPAPAHEPISEIPVDPSQFQQPINPQGMMGHEQVQPNQIDPNVGAQNFLSSLAADMTGQSPTSAPDLDPSRSAQDMVVDAMVEADREKKANARSAWLSMNQQSASDFLNAVGAVQGAPNIDRSSTSLDEVEPFSPPQQSRVSSSSNLPSDTLVRRMVEVAVRRVGRKRGVGVETPQVKAEGSEIRVNVTYIDDGRVLDNPPELHGAFEHAIDTEIRLKGYDVDLLLALFRSKDGEITFSWGEEPQSEVVDDDEEMFECGACGSLVRESDSICPTCGAEFLDDDEEPEPEPSPRVGGPPGGPSRGGPSGGPSRGGPPSGPKGPSRGGPPSGPKGPSRGGPPSGPKGPSRGGPPGGPKGPSRGGPPGGPKGPSRGGPPGGPKGPSRGGPPSGPKSPSRGGPPSGPKGPSGPKKGGPPSGPKKGGPPSGPKGPKRKGPPN
jgi:RNA polymerase subunit RPABC4/transcription elongation factor Spt4